MITLKEALRLGGLGGLYIAIEVEGLLLGICRPLPGRLPNAPSYRANVQTQVNVCTVLLTKSIIHSGCTWEIHC